MDNKKNLKNLKNYCCNNCNFNTRQHNDYNRHLLTAKHKMVINGKLNTLLKFVCICGNEYKFNSGLSRHKKTCNHKPIEELIREPTQKPIEEITQKPIEEPTQESIREPTQEYNLSKIEPNITMFIEIIKENQEFKKLLLEQNSQISEQNNKVIELHKENNILNKENNILINKLFEKESNTTINNNTTNNNQKFNLNIFLNETCKDAMNLKEFVDNIKVSFEELLIIGNTGFVNGISEIFIKRLKELEVTKRPIHCTDVKRETIYLKNDDKWNKDENNNKNLKDAIERVEYKNIYSLNEWCNEHTNAFKSNTDDNDLWLKIYEQTLQGNENTREKVVKNITKKVTIDKE